MMPSPRGLNTARMQSAWLKITRGLRAIAEGFEELQEAVIDWMQLNRAERADADTLSQEVYTGLIKRLEYIESRLDALEGKNRHA